MSEKTSQVDVDHWENYSKSLNDCSKRFFMEVTDDREAFGQLYVSVASKDGNDEDVLYATFEINNLHECGSSRQCVHLHFGSTNLAFSVFSDGGNLIVRPEVGVRFQDSILPDGSFALAVEE